MKRTAPCGPLDGVRSIALLRANALGDFMFLLPALDALRHAYPAARIVLLARRWHAQFLRGRPCGIDEVVEIPDFHGLGGEGNPAPAPREARAFFDEMRARHFDLALQLHGAGVHANPFVRRLGARCTIGARAPGAAPLDRWLPYAPLQNERLRLLELVGLAGAAPVALDPRLPLLPRDVEELAMHWRSDGRPLVVLQPGAHDARRRWPAERFARVGDALAAKGAAIAVNGAEAERETTSAVVHAMRSPPIDFTGTLSISGLAALLARASLVVSNDTGPLHLAQALGTHTVGIFWSTHLMVSAPLAWEGRRLAVGLGERCPVCGVPNLGTRCAHDVPFVADVEAEDVIRLALELFPSPARRRSAKERERVATPARPVFRPDRSPPDEALH